MIPQSISKWETYASITQDGRVSDEIAKGITEMIHSGKYPIEAVDELLNHAEGFQGTFLALVEHTTKRLAA